MAKPESGLVSVDRVELLRFFDDPRSDEQGMHATAVNAVAGEELGFLGSAGLLLVLGFLVVRTLLIAMRARDTFSRLVAIGVACWFIIQIFENVGMNLGMMPVTGLPLPFVSYGGSSMFACWLALGLVNNAHLSGLYARLQR